ncbi:30S ribosomal protein THX [Lysobacter sp. SG-8]|uniref:30S ribosomal protein THX n=2 Tax=Marilutibacter penaei TaxID=2759900 RepID=A0A7W3U6D0_9GAMM|nr:30S ribosomal protein THX [Lysobacter penaei]MBB1089485.1 30S ribosomal protein THX [Lysobacter penaei]
MAGHAPCVFTTSNDSGAPTMGKGDRKTAKGKRYNSSYGNARSKAVTKSTGAASAPVTKKTTKTARKVVAKKAAKA